MDDSNKRRSSVYLDNRDWGKLDAEAKRKERSRSWLVRKILKDYLAGKGKKKE